jgi:integrative and conjugative element protein (TIGR02256 family)
MSDDLINFTDNDQRYKLLVQANLLGLMREFCRSAKQCETGGILIGKYSADSTTAIITEVSPPPSDSRSSNSWFHRGNRGLRQLLAKRWRGAERLFYLGEWHYHPLFVPEPSIQDQRQMEAISHDPSYHCSEPILIIVTVRPDLMKQSDDEIYPYIFPSGEPMIKLQKC